MEAQRERELGLGGGESAEDLGVVVLGIEAVHELGIAGALREHLHGQALGGLAGEASGEDEEDVAELAREEVVVAEGVLAEREDPGGPAPALERGAVVHVDEHLFGVEAEPPGLEEDG